MENVTVNGRASAILQERANAILQQANATLQQANAIVQEQVEDIYGLG